MLAGALVFVKHLRGNQKNILKQEKYLSPPFLQWGCALSIRFALIFRLIFMFGFLCSELRKEQLVPNTQEACQAHAKH